jgi:hypothetical protein
LYVFKEKKSNQNYNLSCIDISYVEGIIDFLTKLYEFEVKMKIEDSEIPVPTAEPVSEKKW